ncbi:hypothetical protein PK35_03290 [Tamlana nanhaiensis]|uniref:Uncharacterized protein n=1 Tax=Neotamlana nanhaiensis TaxID=1382798 RepID=A0A0D7W3Y4_9FLAO|nr:hypothetical protein [Tamlana nanhaiensis]KJD33791.1 hypothetical protein PK35_03290 [Tamlana nanhaiensis]
MILKPQPSGSCSIIPTNTENDAKKVVINATTQLGLQAASVLTINPSFLNPPTFSKQPKIIKNKNGSLHLDYSLDIEFEDQSLISWYRCTDKYGSNPIEISVSRLNKPLKTYKLSQGDIDYFIMAKISPKHKRCHASEPKTVIFSKKITSKDIKSNPNILEPDFETLSAKNQSQVIPRFGL